MRKLTTITGFCLLCLAGVQMSFSKKVHGHGYAAARFSFTEPWYAVQADSFLQSLLVLKKLHSSRAGFPAFRQQFIKSRRAFKRMEGLVSYFDARIYIALNHRLKPEVELEKGTYEHIREPHGLQVLESFLQGSQSFNQSFRAIQQELDLAITTARFLKTYHCSKALTDTGFFIAIQEEMLRIAALGISGFDKPVLRDAIPEAAAALQGTVDLLKHYRQAEPGDSQVSVLTRKLENATGFALYHYRDFESFDRLVFIRDYLQPVLATTSRIIRELYAADDLAESPGTNRSFFEEAYINDHYQQGKPATANMISLGRSLFESTELSGSGRLSCTSCHRPGLDFADTLARNTGFAFSDTLLRNTPSLLNTRYHLHFQRDGHALFMQDQFREVLSNHVEMGNATEAELVANVKASLFLREQMAAAFQVRGDSITYQQVLSALEAFVRSLSSVNSSFDRYMQGEISSISPAVKRGFNLFMGKAKCGTCHFLPVFNGVMPPYCNQEDNEVIGVLETDDFTHPVLSKDPGLFQTTGLELHRGAFKVPSVRNLAKAYPYMHNGSLKNLDDLLVFYNAGGGRGLGANLPNQTLDPEPLRLSRKERDDLKAFMLSLERTTDR